jgi:hypothetical protein
VWRSTGVSAPALCKTSPGTRFPPGTPHAQQAIIITVSIQKKETFCTEADPRPEDLIETKEEKEESRQVNRNSKAVFKEV